MVSRKLWVGGRIFPTVYVYMEGVLTSTFQLLSSNALPLVRLIFRLDFLTTRNDC